MSSLKLSAVEMVQSLKKGEITSEELVKSYIEQIKKKEKEVEAWEFFDQELASWNSIIFTRLFLWYWKININVFT